MEYCGSVIRQLFTLKVLAGLTTKENYYEILYREAIETAIHNNRVVGLNSNDVDCIQYVV